MWVLVACLVLFIVLKAAATQWSRRNRSHGANGASLSQRSSLMQPVMQAAAHTGTDEIVLEIDWPSTFLEIERAIHQGNYDFARTWLQKFAYTTVDQEVPQLVRDRFKQLMIVFARQDPLYQSIMAAILPIVTAQPGMLQTAIYAQLPSYNQEQIRYVLYFAHELGDLTRVKKGRSYQLFGSTQSTILSPGERMGQTILSTSVKISRNPVHDRIAALSREATTHKDVNWDAGVACLQEAAHLMRNSDYYDMDKMLRLPVFLQHAGRFEEAMQEFERLLAEAKSIAQKEMANTDLPTAAKRHTHLYYFHIYDKMHMVCKRQKLKDKAEEYRALSEKHKLVHEELARVVDIERQAQRETYEARR